MSACLDLPDKDYEWIQLSGAWSREAIGMSLVYSGNILMQAEVDTYDVTRMLMGIHPIGFSWNLKPGETNPKNELPIKHKI